MQSNKANTITYDKHLLNSDDVQANEYVILSV